MISDLLKPDAQNLVVREDRRRGVHVEGLSEWVVRSPAEVYTLMERGAEARTTGATKLNEISSRSHAIFMLVVEKSTLGGGEGGGSGGGDGGTGDAMEAFRGLAPGMAKEGGGGGVGQALALQQSVYQSVKVGKLNLVDLAGSERVHVTGATGKRLEESKKINQSLSALGNVIAALTDPKGRDGRPHIPYRSAAGAADVWGRLADVRVGGGGTAGQPGRAGQGRLAWSPVDELLVAPRSASAARDPRTLDAAWRGSGAVCFPLWQTQHSCMLVLP